MSATAVTITIDLRARVAPDRLTEALWTSWAEAAAVTFERFHRPPPPPLALAIEDAAEETPAALTWLAANAAMRASHGNDTDATEMGAYAVAVATVQTVQNWRILGRAQTASGADILMIRTSDPPDAFVKLEVSGMGAGKGRTGRSALGRLLRKKVAQVRTGDLSRPGVAAVVGFELARVLISPVQPVQP